MRLPTCVGCRKVVLALEGQFAKLDSYYLEDGGPPSESAGYWHASCLRASDHGEAWYRARLNNYVAVRRFAEIASTSEWSVVRSPRGDDIFALGRSGESVTLMFTGGKPRQVPGGAVYLVDEEFNLELEDRETVELIQVALTGSGVFPIPALLEMLGVGDRVVHPEALEGAVFKYDRELRGEWQPGFVSARARYGVFVPEELELHVVRGRRLA